MIQLALQCCLQDQRVHGNNIGSLNIEQLEANLTAAATPLSDEVWEKLDEEINELRFAQIENDINKIREEIGDLLFTVINLSRFFGISAENALRGSNNKFVKRFQLLEKKIFDMNKNINDFSSNELDELWKEAKKN